MKSFKKYIKEASGFPTGPVGENPNNLGGSLEVNPSELDNADVLRRINAIIGSVGNHEYLVAEHAIQRLRGSLNKIGLSFPATPQMEGSSGSFDLPLSRFGGRFGKDENTPYDEFLDDDGISHIVEGGLKLNIQYEMIKNSSCKVYAKIM
mgnify:CR=1 FL=1